MCVAIFLCKRIVATYIGPLPLRPRAQFLGPLAFLEGLMKAEGRLWRGTVGAASLQRPPRSFQEGSENPSLRTTYLAAFCAKRGRVLEAVKWRRAAKKPRVCVCAFLAEKGYYSIVHTIYI